MCINFILQAAFRGHKLRLKPTEVSRQMVTLSRPRETNTDLLEERERQYHDALSRDVTSGASDATGPTAVDLRNYDQKVHTYWF